jgi:hypothetical protein
LSRYYCLATSAKLTSSTFQNTLDVDYVLPITAVTTATVGILLQVCAEVDIKLRAALKAGVPVTGGISSSSDDDTTSDDSGDADDDVVTESALDREAIAV